MKDIGWVVITIITFLALGFGLNYYDLVSTRFFAPKYRQVENQVFKNSEQYNDGMVRDLENLKMQYTIATPETKMALRATILHRFSVYDSNLLTPELQKFYNDLKGGM